MAESKRNFQQPGINRDLDDRLLPDGMYRDGVNINVGRSEGDDVGAVENLKGNEQVGDVMPGMDETLDTIGIVRDPNNDRIYWFNKGSQFDSIFEYDEETGMVNTILRDSVSKEPLPPTCAPTFRTFINDPDSDANNRPDLPDLPAPPAGGCTDRNASNFDPGASFDDGSCIAFVDGCTDRAANNFNPNATRDDGSCTFDPGTSLSVTVAASPVAGVTGTAITLTATAADVTGTAVYAWSGGSAVSANAASITVTETADGPQTYTVTVTDGSPDTATASVTVPWSTTPPTIFTFTGTTAASTLAGTTASGGQTVTGVENTATAINYTSMIAIDSPATMRWATLPIATTSPPVPGVTQGAVTGMIGSSNAVNVTIDGSWTPTADVSPVTTWSGGVIEAIPPTGTPLNYNITNWHSTTNPQPTTVNRYTYVSGATTASTHVAFARTTSFGAVDGRITVSFTAEPTGGQPGETTQMSTGFLGLSSFFPATSFIVSLSWPVVGAPQSADYDTTWTITITDIVVTDLSGTTVGTLGTLSGLNGQALTNSQ